MGNPKEKSKAKGFYHVRIVNPDGTVAGDSGYCGPNQITNLGYNYYLCALLGNTTNSKQVGFMALGTGTAPAVAGVTLDGEVMSSTKRTAVTVAVSSDSKKVRFTATFPSGFLSTTSTLQNIGLYAATTTDNQLFAGNTYATSSCASNQACNCTYDISFS